MEVVVWNNVGFRDLPNFWWFILVTACLIEDSLAKLKPFHHHLTNAELNYIFGVQSHKDVPEYDFFFPQFYGERLSSASRQKMKFRAWNQEFEFLLRSQADRLISPDVISVVRDGNKSRMVVGDLPKSSRCHFVGELISHGNASVALSNCNVMRGTIIMPDHFLMLHPLPQRIHSNWANMKNQHGLEETTSVPHVIFKRSPSLWPILPEENQPSQEEHIKYVQQQFTEFCDVKFEYSVPQIATKDSLYVFPNLDPLTLELALFLDSELWRHFVEEFGMDRSEEELTDFSLALINNVHVLYQQPSIQPKINIVLVRHELWKSQPADLASLRHKSGQAQLLLDGFCTYQLRQNPGTDRSHPGHWDHAVLLTGYDIYHTTSSVAGVAPVARMCDQKFSCALVEGLHLGRSFVLAHEMGHSLGMVHDGVQNLCSKSCCLMSPVNGAGKTTWSPCSVRELNAYLLSLKGHHTADNCLIDGASSIIQHDHAKDTRLPGQRYTADQQCSFFWGRDYRHEVPAGRSRSDICNILWCGNGGSTISTAHPALEGTWCGSNRWCIDGKCKEWDPHSPPAVVDGVWSAWARLPNFVCSECKVTGGLRLRRELRICDDPAPNNGGLGCIGSETRGIVCSESSSCTGFTKESYGDSLCSSFRNDIHKPDRQLSGKSFLHPTSTCKVWCHLLGSDLIRNKAQFPDGTPCDKGGYCVNGVCMGAKCIGNNQETKSCKRQPCSIWSDWTSWSICTATCGEGFTKIRSRSCNTGLGCSGEAFEEMKCVLPPCPHWSDWGQWGSCSVTCGGGTEKRTRQCENGPGCAGENEESRSCSQQDCPRWSIWTPWGECSVSCGEGSQHRTRFCENAALCPGPATESTLCNEEKCPEWNEWTSWGECSRTCGLGQKRRSRICLYTENGGSCDGIDTQSQPCNLAECSTWALWTSWTECSRKCGGGISRRSRICLGEDCPGPSQQIRGCSSQKCGEWSNWSAWSDCSQSCGVGNQMRTRNCSGSLCLGSSNETLPCNKGSCIQWAGWGQWSECSTSCGFGKQSRARTCPGQGTASAILITSIGRTVVENTGVSCTGDGEQLRTCFNECPVNVPPTLGTWLEWSNWSSCSVSCGLGFQRRKRTCSGSHICEGNSHQTLTCREKACPSSGGKYLEWEEWTACSQSCGGGLRQRVRHCIGNCVLGETDALQVRTCNNHPCSDLDDWRPWGPWSACSHSCGTGQQWRRRECVSESCNGPGEESATCNTHPCEDSLNAITKFKKKKPLESIIQAEEVPLSEKVTTAQYPEWSPWTSWSGCSCFNEKRVRRRFCQVFEPKLLGYCIGAIHEESACKPSDSCEPVSGKWSEWSKWSACSVECGSSGTAIRHRICSEPFPINRGPYCKGRSFERKDCSPGAACTSTPVDGGWSEWSPWSSCSVSCGKGHRSRTRYCTNPVPSNGGKICNGSDFDLEECDNSHDCKSEDGGWSSWGRWSQCGQSCGFAFQTRKRHCDNPTPESGGRPCRGLSYMTKVCTLGNCPNAVNGGWSTWSRWSSCSANCDYGVQSRSRVCTEPAAKNGGFPCLGAGMDTRTCTNHRLGCSNTLLNDKLVDDFSREWEMYWK